MPSAGWTRTHLRPYWAAILLVSVALLAALALRPLFQGRVPLTVFTIAVVVSAFYGGLIPGLLATGLSALMISVAFAGSTFSILPAQQNLLFFVLLAVILSVIIDQLRRRRMEVEGSKERLEQANRELSRRTEELAVSNDELRRFAYALSHDLQNPLRTVSLFAERLAVQHRERLNEGSAQSLQFILDGVERMQQMIRGLLDYSTAMHHPEPGDERCDANSLVASVLEDLRGAIEESGARVTVDPLPVVAASAGPLRQLFLNVIANAIKYRGEQLPEIQVWAERNGAEWIFAVRDNGIGIDMQYAEKIFGVFERLHGGARYGGSGIGLAICRAIVQRYRGRIWVESKLGRGSTFFFTLPAAIDRDIAKSA